MSEMAASHVARLKEHGFWDYITPGAGGMERFTQKEYASLLDDMASSGMNSLLVCVKWMTTGYRSSLPFLDQLGGPVMDSDNDLLRWVIAEASARRIKVWLSAVVSFYAPQFYGGQPRWTLSDMCGYPLPVKVGVYDADSPQFRERAVAVFCELVDLFPGVGGLMLEVEGSGEEAPHRVELYNAWAAQRRLAALREARPADQPAHVRYRAVARLRDASPPGGRAGD